MLLMLGCASVFLGLWDSQSGTLGEMGEPDAVDAEACSPLCGLGPTWRPPAAATAAAAFPPSRDALGDTGGRSRDAVGCPLFQSCECNIEAFMAFFVGGAVPGGALMLLKLGLSHLLLAFFAMLASLL